MHNDDDDDDTGTGDEGNDGNNAGDTHGGMKIDRNNAASAINCHTGEQ